MKNKIIKVVDEHSIDRDAEIMFAIDVDGSEYVNYVIERDSDNDNIFVSKLIKNNDGTSNMINIEDDNERNNISQIIKELIEYGTKTNALVGNSVVLSSGKTIKIIINPLFNKEQSINVKITYIATVRKAVTKVTKEFYDIDVTTAEVNSTDQSEVLFPNDILPETKVSESLTVDSQPKENVVDNSNVEAIPEPVQAVANIELEVPTQPKEMLVDEAKDSNQMPKVEVEVSSNLPETPVVDEMPKIETQPQFKPNDTLIDQAVKEAMPVMPGVSEETTKVETLPVDNANVLNNTLPVTPAEAPSAEPVAPIVNDNVIENLSNQVVQPEVKEVTPESVVINFVAGPTEAVTVPTLAPTLISEPTPAESAVAETGQLVLDASKEENLNKALDEATSSAIPVENIESVREFGTEKPSGFANGKFLMVIALTFFLASCVFLGYEVFNYFQVK